MLALLASLRARRQTTLVLVTHDLARAAALADRALVLVRGRVAYASDGAPQSAVELERAYRSALDAA